MSKRVYRILSTGQYGAYEGLDFHLLDGSAKCRLKVLNDLYEPTQETVLVELEDLERVVFESSGLIKPVMD